MAYLFFLYLALWAAASMAVLALTVHLAALAITSARARWARGPGGATRGLRWVRLPETSRGPLYLASAGALVYGLWMASMFPPEDAGLMLASVIPFFSLSGLLVLTGLLSGRCASP